MTLPTIRTIQARTKLFKIWERFVTKGEIDASFVRKGIADSWIRSSAYGIDPFNEVVKTKIDKIALEQRQKAFEPFLKIAFPFMETIYKDIGDSGMEVRFTDAQGYVLAYLGDEVVYAERDRYEGINVSEEEVGTNAIGIVIKRGMPYQVSGPEHYSKMFHSITTSAAPIKDEEGNLLAVLSISEKNDIVHPHTLGMILASALAIEHEIKLIKTNDELKRMINHLDAMMQTIVEGILTITHEGVITDVNRSALKILKRQFSELFGKNIDEITGKPIMHMIRNEISASEEKEVQFSVRGRKRTILFSFKPIHYKDDNLREYLITFRETKNVYSQVNKLFGSKAIYTFEDIIGSSKLIKDAVRLAKTVSMTDATILLNGESGTGKELFAQGIHNESPRKNNSFVFINCGAIPRDLVASELFGYEEGAFTGARKGGNPGKFELADGGTLFLDEIGDMPLDTQANLLRVLETKEVVRVGGNEVIPVDVRVIAATHKDLVEEVRKGNFRSDLFYRLNVMPISTPSLRDRKEDIRVMIDYFYLQFTKNEKLKVPIDENFYKVMSQFSWPGNVRELQNVMQMITNLSPDKKRLTSQQIPDYIKEKVGVTTSNDQDDQLVRPLNLIEKEAIINALNISDHNVVQAAKMLEIGRTTLYRKMEKYDIS